MKNARLAVPKDFLQNFCFTLTVILTVGVT
jgi:hypothetical protein